MDRAQEKAIRLLQIEQLLWAHPEGLTRAEIARRLGVNRSTITKYLNADQLPPGIYEAEDGSKRLVMNKDADLTRASFSLHEVMAIHLATRLLATRTDKQNPHAASALRKLGKALERLDKNISAHLLRSADVMDEDRDYRDPVYLKVLETLTEAWSAGRKVRVQHQMENGRIFDYTLSPYFIEPYAVGQTAHVIGLREPPGKLRTLKIERIRAAEITRDPYTIPADFDPRTLLRDAWGIWTSDREPVEVVLRFHPRVAMRVRETRWHPSQRIEEQADGFVLWRAQVAEPQEMLPWVRGWGASVEVVEPKELRNTLTLEVSRLAILYGVETRPPNHMLFWAKTNKDGQTHPLICHLIDVGQVALTLWNEVLTDGFRMQVAEALGLNSDHAGRLFAFWAACHDIGKASPNFQRKHPPAKPELEAAGFAFPTLMGKSTCYHATISALILPDTLREATGLDEELGRDVAQALGGHHGSWPTDQVRRQHRSQLGDGNWPAAQQALIQELADVFEPPLVTRLGRDETEIGTLLVLLSGLTSVADWIGSMNEYFPFSTPHIAPEQYAVIADRNAHRALGALGWLDWQPPLTLLSFEDLHGFKPRAAQEEVINLLPGEREPTLLIAEIATGTGKTELALYLADRWAVLRQQRGLYVAMPTQATSNQMHGRVGSYLRKRYPEQQINFHLIHSGARWREDQKVLDFKTENEEPQGTIKAQGWFLPRKRTLLAPFSVGTVDQALMGTLQTRHFFVRLFGLSGKTIIFDEVHAYDTYMNTLFERLLVWLRAVGASVIVLSATLPAMTRHALIKAWRGSDVGLQDLDAKAYPSVTVANQNELYTKALPRGDNRTVNVEWIDPRPEAIAEALCDLLADGGCAAVICNRVDRAQTIYKAIDNARLVAPDDLLLFHARTPGIWRDATEKSVLDRFGKNSSQRPHRSIVVATQVIEQSLDLDFDVMITDLAPIDLLLQRAGRLHRHEREQRPPRLETPTLLVTSPRVNDENALIFGGDGFVYEPYVLFRSLWTLQANGPALKLPEQTVDLIEAVYGDEDKLPEGVPENAPALLATARTTMESNEGKARFEANKRLVVMPNQEDLLWLRNEMLEEDDAQVHDSLRAMTRLMRPTIDVVCLHGQADADIVTLDAGGVVDVDLTQEPSADLTRELALRVVTISHPVVRRHFASQDSPRGWRDHALLHTHRKAIFTDGVCELNGSNYLLRLSPKLGLEIVNLDDKVRFDQ